MSIEISLPEFDDDDLALIEELLLFDPDRYWANSEVIVRRFMDGEIPVPSPSQLSYLEQIRERLDEVKDINEI